MKFTVNQGQLEAELNLALGCAGQKDVGAIPLSKIHLDANTSGRLVINTTNTEVAYTSVLEADVDEPGTVMLEAKRIADHISSQSGESVSFARKGGKLTIRCGKNKSTMPIYADGELPATPEETQPLVNIPATVLASLVNRVSFAISNEDSRFTLTAAQLEVSQAGLVSVATNAKTLSHANYASTIDVDSDIHALIPKKAISELVKIASKAGEGAEFSLAVDRKKNLFFRLGNRVLWSRGIAANFPRYHSCFMDSPAGKTIVRGSELKETVERVGNFADDESSSIGFVFDTDSLTITADSRKRGSSEEPISVEYDGNPVEIYVSSKFVLEFLRLAGDRKVEVTVRDGSKPLELRLADDPSWTTIIMPMLRTVKGTTEDEE